ncbi:MAG: hypothetical protein ACI38U_02175 [Corynebacterium sp.]|uniref:hypothetical protein n=1 Tax=Corynebacterium sp. TaxID=1720 RepID=UPI003F06A29B
MAADRHERVRGAWVLSHAGRRPGARRRGERLMAAARRQERQGIDAGDAPASEVITPGFFRRITRHEDGDMNIVGWTVVTAVALALAAWLIGIGVLVGWLIYMTWWWLVPRVPKLDPIRVTPLAGVATAAAGVCALTWLIAPPVGMWDDLVALWQRAQWVIAPAYAAWLTYAWGWTAVTKAASTPSATLIDLRPQMEDEDTEEQDEDELAETDDDGVLLADPYWDNDNNEEGRETDE